jgi:hypothetical protein
MLGYDCLLDIDQRIKQILCHFHHQQGVTHYLLEHFEEEQIPKRKKEMKKVLQTEDKRTVKRRFLKLKKFAQKLGIEKWVSHTEKKLPKLLPSVGSKKIPRTNNAIERFFRAFSRFYKVRCGFFSIISAKKELIFFMLMYLFLKQPETGKAPLEAIIVRYVEIKVGQSWEQIAKLFRQLHVVELITGAGVVFRRCDLESEHKAILKALGISLPKEIQSVSVLNY